MMQQRFFLPVIACVGLILILLGSMWVLGSFEGMSLSAGWAVTLGVGAAMALGIGLMAVILFGRRSRRDEAVHRATDDNDYE
jgi:hypothetical protein